MTDLSDTSAAGDARHEGASFEPVPRDAETPDAATPDTPTSDYPPEADPDKGGDVPAAEVAGEQTDPEHRLTGGDQPSHRTPGTTEGDQVTPGSVEPPD